MPFDERPLVIVGFHETNTRRPLWIDARSAFTRTSTRPTTAATRFPSIRVITSDETSDLRETRNMNTHPHWKRQAIGRRARVFVLRNGSSASAFPLELMQRLQLRARDDGFRPQATNRERQNRRPLHPKNRHDEGNADPTKATGGVTIALYDKRSPKETDDAATTSEQFAMEAHARLATTRKRARRPSLGANGSLNQ